LGARIGVNPDDFPEGLGLAIEEVTAITHAGTHLDAPWHFGPQSEGKPARTIDQIPLEWCYGDGVVLDFRYKKPNGLITRKDIKEALARIDYRIKPKDIVLLQTGADRCYGTVDYSESHPGMSREATILLLDQGVKVIGTDGYGFDSPFSKMADDHKAGKKGALWPAHFLGREREYCHIEKLTNLDKIPRPYGFKVVFFPIKIAGASAGWCRAVAIVEE
jgi:kynurenine formamidase